MSVTLALGKKKSMGILKVRRNLSLGTINVKKNSFSAKKKLELLDLSACWKSKEEAEVDNHRKRDRHSYRWLKAAINGVKKQSKENQKHPGVYVDKETAQVATLSEISTRLASTRGPLSDANDCCWGEQGGWYWCAGATKDAEPDSPSTALFCNEPT